MAGYPMANTCPSTVHILSFGHLPENSTGTVTIKVTLRNNPALFKEFTIYIKKKPDPDLKTMDELMKKPKTKGSKN
jgi:hypothetical protein